MFQSIESTVSVLKPAPAMGRRRRASRSTSPIHTKGKRPCSAAIRQVSWSKASRSRMRTIAALIRLDTARTRESFSMFFCRVMWSSAKAMFPASSVSRRTSSLSKKFAAFAKIANVPNGAPSTKSGKAITER